MVSPKDMFLEISVNEEHFVFFFLKLLKIQAFKLFYYLFVLKIATTIYSLLGNELTKAFVSFIMECL